MSRRKTLIGLSIAGHAALFAGVLIHGIWDLEQLEYELRSRSALAVMTPPASEASPRTSIDRQTKQTEVVKGPRQPTNRPPVKPTPTTGTIGTGPETGSTDGPPVDGPPGDPCVVCETTPATLPVPQPPPPPPPPPEAHNVTPQMLKGLRLSGETAIHPPRDVFHQMHRDGNHRTSAAIKVCLSSSGAVSSIKVLKSSKYQAYDDAIVAAARRWVYRPYTVNGTPVPACGAVTFLYEMN